MITHHLHYILRVH